MLVGGGSSGAADEVVTCNECLRLMPSSAVNCSGTTVDAFSTAFCPPKAMVGLAWELESIFGSLVEMVVSSSDEKV